MTPEEYINKHPFPKNGAEINDKLVRDIKDPTKEEFKAANLEKLLQNNARLIYLVYRQYNYNQELSSIMSFVYEGLTKSVNTFNPNIGMPFYHYAMSTIRGLLQNYYNYHNDLIHIPVMKKNDIKYEYADINDFNEHQYGIDESTIEDDNNLSDEMNNLIIEYESRATFSDKTGLEFEMLKKSRGITLKALGDETGYKTAKLRRMIDNAVDRLKKYHKRYMEDIG